MSDNPQRIDLNRRMSLPLGAHVSMKKPKGLLGSVESALAMNATAFMVFLGPPRSTLQTPFENLHSEEALEKWKEAGRKSENIVVHFRYVLNPSSPERETREFAAECFEKELSLMDKAGLSLCCFHPGSSKGEDRLKCAAQAADTLKPVFKAHPGIRIAIECMAGKTNETGVGLVEVSEMIRRFDLPNVGLCLDTCHLWDSGFDVQDTGLLVDSLSNIVGLNRVFLIHLNDSLNPRGARKDRHARIGEGYIGFRALDAVLGIKELWDVPKILETPDPGDGSSHSREIELLRKGLGI